MKKLALITGSNGLIGSQSVSFFIEKGYRVIGIDNNMRAYFFGEDASTAANGLSLKEKYKYDYNLFDLDIRNYHTMKKYLEEFNFDIIIHTAAQPSHDWAAKEPLTDFTINAMGTMNLLELTRIHWPKATFIFTSTNKVYGDRPNTEFIFNDEITRWQPCKSSYGSCLSEFGINENMSIDNSIHSVFGASKVAADVMCQEYGKYFNMNVGIFRGGCLTGPNHAGTELHGFLSYLVKCIVHNKPYTIFGHEGKQVRDNIHSEDLVNMFWHFHQNPKKGEVYNVGGGKDNSISILEAIDKINKIAKTNWDKYTLNNQSRIGDHKWYISDIRKFENHYSKWKIKHNIDDIINLMVKNEQKWSLQN